MIDTPSSNSSDAEPGRPRQRRSVVRMYLELTLIGFIFLNFSRVFLVQAFRIPSESMRESLLVGDHILVNKFVFSATGSSLIPGREIVRGDVVVFRSPERPGTRYVKRVVGLPGEMIELRQKRLFVDGAEVVEPYIRLEDPRTYPRSAVLPEPQRSRDHFGPLLIPPGSYFVLGDNRDRSYDSRFWGVVPRQFIAGRAFVVYWSFDGIDSSGAAYARLKELGHVVRNFFPRTRWRRTLTPIAGYDYARPRLSPRGSTS